MAIGDFRLTTSRYVRPGVYIGYVRIPRPAAEPTQPRYPCYVGRGSRLAVVANLAHRRSYVENEELSFSLTPPYQAPLPHPAINDQTIAFLYKQDRTVITTDKWAFREAVPGSGVFNRVEIIQTEFDKHATYLIDYQSSERDDIDDPLKFDQLRQMTLVGDTEGQDKYREFVDYRVVTDVVGNTASSDPDGLVPASTNSHLTGRNTVPVPNPLNTGLGVLLQDPTSEYEYNYSRSYKLVCTGVTAGPPATATFELVYTPLSGGNDQHNRFPMYSAFEGTGEYNNPLNLAGRTFEFTVTEPAVAPPDNYTIVTLAAQFPSAEYGDLDGIILRFDFNTGNFASGDEFTWDSFGPGRVEISSAHDNDNQFAEVSAPVEGLNYLDGANAAGSGKITINAESAYTGTFDRHYRMQVYYYPTSPTGPTGDGPTGDRKFNIVWSAWDEQPYTEGLIQIREDDLVNYPLTKIPLEDGIYLDVDLGAGHVARDTTNIITATYPVTNLATALALAVDAKAQYDAHDADPGPPTWHSVAGGSHQTTAAILPTSTEAELVAFCVNLQTQYTAHINDSAMHVPIDDIFVLDDITVTDLQSAVSFLNDFAVKYERHRQALNFVEGDTWTFTARAARQDYTAKDSRLYTMTMGAVTGTTAAVSWYTDTWEGSFGSFNLTAADPVVTMTDNITLLWRNYPTTDATQQFAANDQFIFTTVDEELIDWSLRTRTEQTIPADEIFQDPLGQVTGVPTSWYIILNDTPETVMWVRKVTDQTPLSYTLIYDQGEPTPYIMLATDPGTDIEVKYEHRGQEPAPGNYYYVSANRLRLNSEYERPIRYLNRDDMEAGLAPKTSDNHLWIAGDIAFDTDFFGAYFCQVKDAAGNQVFTTADFRRAIQATETVKAITDLVVLEFYPALGESKASIERMADPFKNSERMLWVGVPIGTPLGSVDEPDTLIYLAKKTLQFAGDNPGRGHVVLLGNTYVDRTLVFDDGTVTRVQLDGSFLAAYTAALNASFTDPAATLLRKDVAAFDDMQVWNEQEGDLLGEAQVLYCDSVGASVFRYQQSTTLDTSAVDLREISAMNQKMFVTRVVARDMDEALIAIVPPSAAAGVAIVRAFLADELARFVSRGIIAPYGQELNPPTIRPINPATDVYVFVDEQDRTLYHFGYFYNLRYPIKKLFGLFSVDTKFWDARNDA